MIQVDSDIIKWDKFEPLSWNDFQMDVPDTLQSSYYSAVSYINIKIKGYVEDGIPHFEANTLFYKKLSWAKPSLPQYVLDHENIHFSLAELYSRKVNLKVSELRKRQEYNIDVYKEEIQLIIEEWKDTDKKYDLETNHGINQVKQREWNVFVYEGLELQIE